MGSFLCNTMKQPINAAIHRYSCGLSRPPPPQSAICIQRNGTKMTPMAAIGSRGMGSDLATFATDSRAVALTNLGSLREDKFPSLTPPYPRQNEEGEEARRNLMSPINNKHSCNHAGCDFT